MTHVRLANRAGWVGAALAALFAGCMSVGGSTPVATGSPSGASASPSSLAVTSSPLITPTGRPTRTRRPCAPGDTRPRCQTPTPATSASTASPTTSPTASPTTPPTASPTAPPAATATTSGSAQGGPLSVAPTTIYFGDVRVGATSPEISVVVTNTGTADVGPINMFGGAPPTSEFGAAQNCQGNTLAAGETCEITYDFSPSSTGAFNDTSSFTISPTDSQSDGYDFTVMLSGNGIAAP